ncbi:hypothetical protein [Lysobacter niastensis]|uniref:Uncharacterized protein n=1 Tax=Lysobacter niastensis TaxID=380629 RepID=A0ABS0B7J6_9GAMM|nr:hypothetical protein [Lysobacter niastensis]MBF6023085.1 hypothetical protein [Lysobacter niastensis]
MHTTSRVIAALLLVTGLLFAATAPAQKVVVNGDMWLKSSPEIRKAFLVGAGNMIAMEKAYASKKGTAQPAVGTMAAKAVEGMTLDQVSQRITRWYEANPQRRDVPVMGVIWIDLVKPAAPAGQ